MKKGFTLVELLVSIAILSIAMVFISVFVLNLKDDRGKVLLNVPVLIDQAAISKKLNYDAEVMGIKSITPYGNKQYKIEYLTNEARIIRISDDNKTLTYDDENSNIYLVKTLNNNAFGKTVNGNTTYFDATSSVMSGGSVYTKLTIYLSDDDNINLYNYNDGKSRVRVILDVNGGKAWTSSTCPAINEYNFEEVTSECSKTFASGSEIGSLLNPSRTGYTFISWYDARGALVKPNKVLTENETLYAQWSPNNYQVSFDKRGGTGGIDGTTATYDKVLSLSSEDLPTMVGKDFAGYYTTSSGGNPIITGSGQGSVWKFEESKTLYAQWSTKTISCQLGKYLPKNSESCSNCPGGSYCASNPSICQYSTSSDCGITGTCNAGTYSQTGASACTPCAAGTSQSQSGKTSCTACSKGKFQSATGQTSCITCAAGYYTDETGQTSCKQCDNGYTSNPTHTGCVARTYTVTFDVNGGNEWTSTTCPTSKYAFDSSLKTCSKGVQYTTNYGEMPTPTKTDYTFSGWHTAANGGSKVSSTDVMSNTDKTLYAKWCRNCAEVSNGSCSLDVTAGTCSYTTVCDFGYELTSGSGTYNPTCTRSIFTLTLNCDNGSGNPPQQSIQVNAGSYTPPTTNYCGTKIVAGAGRGTNGAPGVKYQNGWSTTQDGAKIASVTISSDITLYPAWEKLFTYSGDYEIIKDSSSDWRARMLNSGTLIFNKTTAIDIFSVGGGGGGGGSSTTTSTTGGYIGGGGGGGGYTNLCTNESMAANTDITVTIGAGGTGVSGDNGNDGEQTVFYGSSAICNAAGGRGGCVSGRVSNADHSCKTSFAGSTEAGHGGDGGSGGGGGGKNAGAGHEASGGAGGMNGSIGQNAPRDGQNGGYGGYSPGYSSSGSGSPTTSTCEFRQGTAGSTSCNESTISMYSGGGGGGSGYRSGGSVCGAYGLGGTGGGGAGGNCATNGSNGTANTGGGGGGAGARTNTSNYAGGNGGSGVVVIRNTR